MTVSKKNVLIFALSAAGIIFLAGLSLCHDLGRELTASYQKNESLAFLDRGGKTILIKPNPKGYWSQYLGQIPEEFKKLLIEKEDRFFYWHKGFNPISILGSLGNDLGVSQRKGSSTISQQLAKILLGQENERSLSNKFKEVFYTIGLEFSQSKENILLMYLNSAYFGNQLQGLRSASLAYFGVSPDLLTKEQSLQLLASLGNPTYDNPLSDSNIEKAKILSENLKVDTGGQFTSSGEAGKNLDRYSSANQLAIELGPYLKNIPGPGKVGLTIDSDLTDKVRGLIQKNIDILKNQKAKNAAVIILNLPDNSILGMVGSPDQDSFKEGYQINMLQEPRQIGSTVKPFIYLKAFQKGMRPYTLIDDREYKYPAGQGFDIYPKNYDYKYHGEVSAHYALSNSLNVPAVKTLEYAGIGDFNKFLTGDLEFKPVQNLDNYQLGIALGALEMSLMDLGHFFTIFPNQGVLKNLTLFEDSGLNSQFFPDQEKTVSSKEYIDLINKILNDRKTGVDQFGAESDLNLPYSNYALKTGTSHDYTDSWVVGYTPDFLVGVWMGNADNSATEGLSGQLGAGRIWNDVMQLLMNSKYNKKTDFDFSDLVSFDTADGIDFGLKDDDFEMSRDIIKNGDQTLILSPHDEDIFLFDDEAAISLKSKDSAIWKINGEFFGQGDNLLFHPPQKGRYEIAASANGKTETVFATFKDKK
jgi:membrane carboxypeptidase/penicillin-binding protein PbpC